MVGLQADEMLVVGSCLLIESLMGVDISAEEECLGMVSVQVQHIIVVHERTLVIASAQVKRSTVQEQPQGGGREVESHAIVFQSLFGLSPSLLYVSQVLEQDGVGLQGRFLLECLSEQRVGLRETVHSQGIQGCTHVLLVSLCL